MEVFDPFEEIPSSTQCKHCGRHYGGHAATTMKCPTGLSETGSFWHEFQTFEPVFTGPLHATAEQMYDALREKDG